MNQLADTDLVEIGRNVAQHVAGAGTVERVKVSAGQDSTDRPAYFFSFLIDRYRDGERAGLIRIRLEQKLRDELMARDDGHHPIVQVLNRADWEQHEGAGPH
jgi:hypothetical protein